MTTTKQIRNLTKDKIISCAMNHLAENGLAQLSMRKIANELNVQVSALYNHFAQKQALIIALQNHYLSSSEHFSAINFAAPSWQDFIRSIANTTRNEFLKHPFALELFTSHSSESKASILHFEKYLGKMLEFGFTLNHAAQISQTIYTYTCGFTNFELGVLKSNNEDKPAQILQNILQVETPLSNKFHSEYSFNFNRDFAFGIESLITGFSQFLNKDIPCK